MAESICCSCKHKDSAACQDVLKDFEGPFSMAYCSDFEPRRRKTRLRSARLDTVIDSETGERMLIATGYEPWEDYRVWKHVTTAPIQQVCGGHLLTWNTDYEIV